MAFQESGFSPAATNYGSRFASRMHGYYTETDIVFEVPTKHDALIANDPEYIEHLFRPAHGAIAANASDSTKTLRIQQGVAAQDQWKTYQDRDILQAGYFDDAARYLKAGDRIVVDCYGPNWQGSPADSVAGDVDAYVKNPWDTNGMVPHVRTDNGKNFVDTNYSPLRRRQFTLFVTRVMAEAWWSKNEDGEEGDWRRPLVDSAGTEVKTKVETRIIAGTDFLYVVSDTGNIQANRTSQLLDLSHYVA